MPPPCRNGGPCPCRKGGPCALLPGRNCCASPDAAAADMSCRKVHRSPFLQLPIAKYRQSLVLNLGCESTIECLSCPYGPTVGWLRWKPTPKELFPWRLDCCIIPVFWFCVSIPRRSFSVNEPPVEAPPPTPQAPQPPMAPPPAAWRCPKMPGAPKPPIAPPGAPCDI